MSASLESGLWLLCQIQCRGSDKLGLPCSGTKKALQLLFVPFCRSELPCTKFKPPFGGQRSWRKALEIQASPQQKPHSTRHSIHSHSWLQLQERPQVRPLEELPSWALVNPWNCEIQQNGTCFKTLTFGVTCCVAIGNWNSWLLLKMKLVILLSWAYSIHCIAGIQDNLHSFSQNKRNL